MMMKINGLKLPLLFISKRNSTNQQEYALAYVASMQLMSEYGVSFSFMFCGI